MDILHLANCNLVIGAPSDMRDGSCNALPVQVYTDEQQNQWACSFWKPSEEELKQLNEGGVICLHVRAGGRQHPVVSLGTSPLT